MNRYEFKRLALLGLAGGLMTSGLTAKEQHLKEERANEASPQKSSSNPQERQKKKSDPNDGNLGYHLMTEEELLMELDDEGTKIYRNLDPAGKALALKVASARCNKTNECKGLNSCKTDHNSCAGKGPCKAQGQCSLADKNFAVRLVSEKMKNKRENAANPSTPH
jgi:hypothetical protein